MPTRSVGTIKRRITPVGAGLARDSGGSSNKWLADTPLSQASQRPHGNSSVLEAVAGSEPALFADRADRSHALRGNAALDALRPLLKS